MSWESQIIDDSDCRNLDWALEQLYFGSQSYVEANAFNLAYHYDLIYQWIAAYSESVVVERIHYLMNKRLRSLKDVSGHLLPFQGSFHYSNDMSHIERVFLFDLLKGIKDIDETVHSFAESYWEIVGKAISIRRRFLSDIQSGKRSNPIAWAVGRLFHIFHCGGGSSYSEFPSEDRMAWTMNPADVEHAIKLGYPIGETLNSYGHLFSEDYATFIAKLPRLTPGSTSFDMALLRSDPWLYMRYIRESSFSQNVCCDLATTRCVVGCIPFEWIPFRCRTKSVCAAFLEAYLKECRSPRNWRGETETVIGRLLRYFPYSSFTPEIKRLVERECPGCIDLVPDEAEWGNENMNGWLAGEL